MKALLVILAAWAFAGLAWAQPHEGKVRKIDKAKARITLEHGEIRSLTLPPMTMTYRVRDARALDALAIGDKVKFEAQKVGGQYTVTLIRKN